MPASLPNPIKTNPLGQFTDEFVDAGKGLAGDVAKTTVTEPKKILESILGKATTSPNEKSNTPGIEDMSGGQQVLDPAQIALKQQQHIAQKQAADRQQADALLRLHRQRLQEEEAFFAQSQQQKQLEKQQEEQDKQVKKNEEIVQLQHEQQKEDVLGSMIKQYEGSKEQKAWGAG
jgi:hypothetical protein